jgi:hypothetical protein
MTIARKYDIGGGVTIEDNGFSFTARIQTETCGASLGIRRPIDYLTLCQQRAQEQERRFNEFIAPSGRTLAWITKKIGPWVEPKEPPVIALTD